MKKQKSKSIEEQIKETNVLWKRSTIVDKTTKNLTKIFICRNFLLFLY